jgi:hypothetical protein
MLQASGVTLATTPWWRGPPASRLSRASSLSTMRAPASCARSTNCRMRASRRVASTWISVMDCGAVFNRTVTAWKPNRTLVLISPMVALHHQPSLRPARMAPMNTGWCSM